MNTERKEKQLKAQQQQLKYKMAMTFVDVTIKQQK